MSNKFCRYLSNGYTFSFNKNNLLSLKPCCWFQDNDANVSFEEKRKQFDQINGWTASCKNCKSLEDSGQQSMRLAANDWIPDIDNTDAYSVDIFLDNSCNAACVICNSYASSLWGKQDSKFKNLPIVVDTNKLSVDQIIDKIFETTSLEKVTYIKIFGGEPLFTDTHIKFLSRIPNPEYVTVHYTTNGSIFPNKKTLEIWDRFKTIIFAASLDGVDQQFDYIRWPLPWNKVSKNLIRLKNKNIHNLLFRVEFTVNWLNAYYYDRVENWVQENFYANLSGDRTEINLHPCQGIWNLNNMPWSIRNLVLNKYPNTHTIHNFVKNLPAPASLMPWKNFVSTWDHHRENSWQHAFPELVPLVLQETSSI